MNIDLYQGDCLDIMKDIPDGSIDMILADLPYGTTACSWDSVINLDSLWKQYERIIKYKGNIVLYGSEPFTSKLRMSKIDWYRYDWIWEKNNASNFQLVNYQPLKVHETISVFYDNYPYMRFSNIMRENMKRLNLKQIDISKLQLSKTGGLTGWVTNKLNGSQLPTREQWNKICNLFGIENNYDELIKEYEKKQPTYNLNLKEIERICSNKGKGGSLGHLSSETKREKYLQSKTGYPKSILKFNRETGLHPTQKPVELTEFLIRTYSNEGEMILDNTMGSGTTGVACINTNRNFIGIEKDEKYFNVAKERIEKYKKVG